MRRLDHATHRVRKQNKFILAGEKQLTYFFFFFLGKTDFLGEKKTAT